VTGYGLDGPGIESRWGARFSAPVQTGPGAHPASCTMGTGSFLGSKERQGCDADPSPPSSAVGHERVELYLYSPYGPYGLYRASVPVQGVHSFRDKTLTNFNIIATTAKFFANSKKVTHWRTFKTAGFYV